MTGWIARTLVPLIVALGLLVPQGAGVAAALGLTFDRVMVICTGDGLRTLRFDADGNPVEVSDSPDTCALVHAADTSEDIIPIAAPEDALASAPAPVPQPLRAVVPAYLPSLPRAPPLV